MNANDLEGIRQQLADAKAAKDKAFEEELSRYHATQGSGKESMTLIEWMKQHGNDYFEAWKREDNLEKKYEGLQNGVMDDVLRALATMKSADSKLDFKLQ